MYQSDPKAKAISGVIATPKQSAAGEVVHLAQNLNQRAMELVGRMNDKLYPVMVSDRPREERKPPIGNIEYPPLFSDLLGNLRGIEDALDTIEYTLSRTEL